jgi:hypothetical protein
MVRLRTIGVVKSPPLIEIDPLRSAGAATGTATGGGVAWPAASSGEYVWSDFDK